MHQRFWAALHGGLLTRARTRGRRRAAAALLVFALGPEAAAVAQDAREKVSPFYGSFSSAVPIAVPAFRGLEPKLALAYTSEARNGFVGVGWSLAGVSSIERVSAGRGTPLWDATDTYLLDGQELIACQAGSVSPSCTTGGTHATKIESYVRIKLDATANAFTVWGKDGTRTTFSPTIVSSGYTLRWGQTATTDTYGNTVTYAWTCPEGDCYPDTITYGPYVVTLVRESRPDPLKFAAGYHIGETKYRLGLIVVRTGAQPVRAYKLTYAKSDVTGRSLLTSVQQFGRDVVYQDTTVTAGTSLPPETFIYSSDSAGHALSVRAANRPPTATLSHSGTCTSQGGCVATFSASASDPDADPLALSWTGCASGTGTTMPCTRTGAGLLAATVSASDGRGGVATRSDAATVYATGYGVGAWGACASTQAWTCTSNTATGCTRSGTQTRTVAETGWVWDTNPGLAVPPASQSCTLTAPGYIATYTSTYSAWSCTAAGTNGCSKTRQSYAVASYGPTGPDAPVPAGRPLHLRLRQPVHVDLRVDVALHGRRAHRLPGEPAELHRVGVLADWTGRQSASGHDLHLRLHRRLFDRRVVGLQRHELRHARVVHPGRLGVELEAGPSGCDRARGQSRLQLCLHVHLRQLRPVRDEGRVLRRGLVLLRRSVEGRRHRQPHVLLAWLRVGRRPTTRCARCAVIRGRQCGRGARA